MTQYPIAEVRERLKALLSRATPGPWSVDEDALVTLDPVEIDMERSLVADLRYFTTPHAMDNAALIAEAVNALPALLTHLDAVEGENARLRGDLGAHRIHDVLDEGDGLWQPCSGCYETNEGYDVGPLSKTFRCHLGSGCRECGGIGAIWDTTDYGAMADAMIADDAEHEALQAQLASQAASLAEMRGALEPFAKAVDSADSGQVPDSAHAWESSMAMVVTYGDFRRAHAVRQALQNKAES